MTDKAAQPATHPLQGHAKLMCHPDVTVMDAVYAVVLLESSVDGRSWDGILRGPLTFNLLVLSFS